MSKFFSTTPEIASQWDNLANIASLEAIPDELPIAGGFEYLVLPTGILQAKYAFGGYDTIDDQTGDVESLVLVDESIPSHVRGLLVAHMVLHKIVPDDGTPQLCRNHDSTLQSVMADLEPSLIEPFYDEAEVMYVQGFSSLRTDASALYHLATERYKTALKNSRFKGKLAHDATDRRKRLEDAGLVLPDGESGITAVDKRSGQRTLIYLQEERGTRHKCKNCSHAITKGSPRITTSTNQKVNGYDHHHYHPGCFTHVELGIFGDIHQVPHEDHSRH